MFESGWHLECTYEWLRLLVFLLNLHIEYCCSFISGSQVNFFFILHNLLK